MVARRLLIKKHVDLSMFQQVNQLCNKAKNVGAMPVNFERHSLQANLRDYQAETSLIKDEEEVIKRELQKEEKIFSSLNDQNIEMQNTILSSLLEYKRFFEKIFTPIK